MIDISVYGDKDIAITWQVHPDTNTGTFTIYISPDTDDGTIALELSLSGTGVERLRKQVNRVLADIDRYLFGDVGGPTAETLRHKEHA